MEEENEEIKVGDIVELISTGQHNSNAFNYKLDVAFSRSEIGFRLKILDIEIDRQKDIAYKVRCGLGVTYLRREAFKLVENQTEELIHEDLSYLIPILKQYDIII